MIIIGNNAVIANNNDRKLLSLSKVKHIPRGPSLIMFLSMPQNTKKLGIFKDAKSKYPIQWLKIRFLEYSAEALKISSIVSLSNSIHT